MERLETIDCEASGLGEESYPIEIGYVLPDGTRQSYLIKREPQWEYWDQYAEDRIHKISRDTLEKEGIDAAEVATRLNSQLDIVYSDALKHDRHWIDQLYKAVNIERTFEIHSIYSVMKPEEADHFLKFRRQLFAQHGKHRAEIDAWVNQEAHVLSVEKHAEFIAAQIEGDK